MGMMKRWWLICLLPVFALASCGPLDGGGADPLDGYGPGGLVDPNPVHHF